MKTRLLLIALSLCLSAFTSFAIEINGVEVPDQFRIVNRWSSQEMIQDGDTVAYRDSASAFNNIWEFVLATDTTVEIMNTATGDKMHMENVAAYPEMGGVAPVWLSAKWIVEDGGEGFVTIRSAWYGHFYLNVEGQAGYVENSGLDPTWWSGQWAIVPVGEPQDTTSTTGIFNKQAAQSGFEVFPNPATSLVYIRGNAPIEQVSVFDLTGQLVEQFSAQSAATVHLDVNQLSGIYLVKVGYTDGESAVKRLIVK